MTNFMDILQAYASEQCKFLLRRQNHVGSGPSVSGLVHPKKHRSGRRVWREAGAIRHEHAHRQEMPTSAQLFIIVLSLVGLGTQESSVHIHAKFWLKNLIQNWERIFLFQGWYP